MVHFLLSHLEDLRKYLIPIPEIKKEKQDPMDGGTPKGI